MIADMLNLFLCQLTRMVLIGRAAIHFLELYRREMGAGFACSKRFVPPQSPWKAVDSLDRIVHWVHVRSIGWIVPAEMVGLIRSEVPNTLFCQPFGCLRSQIIGRGVIKEVRRRYLQANVTPLISDPGASEVNQLNQLKLMLANASLGVHPNNTKVSSRR
jgi:predicted nucleotide-binding protein (sugar kinase/HSP70/actin superfamily)